MGWNHKISGRLQFRHHVEADRVYIDKFGDDGWRSFDNLSPEDFTEVCKSWLDRDDEPDKDMEANVVTMGGQGPGLADAMQKAVSRSLRSDDPADEG